jgi:VanZ family protein
MLRDIGETMMDRRILKYWLPVILWMLVIFFGSTDLLSAANTSKFLVPFLRWLYHGINELGLLQAQFLVRKAGHVTEYAILMVLIWRAADHYREMESFTWRWQTSLHAFLLTVAYAASDEFHQSFYSSRTASVRDVFVDACGALAGLALVWIVLSFRRTPYQVPT